MNAPQQRRLVPMALWERETLRKIYARLPGEARETANRSKFIRVRPEGSCRPVLAVRAGSARECTIHGHAGVRSWEQCQPRVRRVSLRFPLNLSVRLRMSAPPGGGPRTGNERWENPARVRCALRGAYVALDGHRSTSRAPAHADTANLRAPIMALPVSRDQRYPRAARGAVGGNRAQRDRPAP
jgi:hypothetical protein